MRHSTCFLIVASLLAWAFMAPRLVNAADSIGGRVVHSATGRPIAGALVYASSAPDLNKVTDSSGRFQFDEMDMQVIFENAEADRLVSGVQLAAVAEGFGMDFVDIRRWGIPTDDDISVAADQEVELRLPADDVPIHGRLVDADNRPIVGASVEIGQVCVMPDGDLSEWINSWRISSGRRSWAALLNHLVDKRYTPLRRRWNFSHRVTALGEVPTRFVEAREPGLTAKVTTDEEGRFLILGVGKERIAWLTLTHPEFERTRVFVATRDNFEMTTSDTRLPPHYGATFTHILASRDFTIHGSVLAGDTGRPFKGVKVAVAGEVASTNKSGSYSIKVSDSQGRVLFLPPADQPYVAQKMRLAIEQQSTAQLDCELERGLLVNGCVISTANGQGVQGASLEYLPLINGAERTSQLIPDARDTRIDPFLTAQDGSFSVAVPRHHGAILVRVWYGGQGQFAACEELALKEAFHGGVSYRSADGRPFFETPDGRRIDRTQYHAVVKITPNDTANLRGLVIRLSPAAVHEPEAVQGSR